MVDAAWLESVRAKNRAAFGLGGLGVSAQDIVRGHRGERELRTQSIHRGRFERTDPYKPKAGSIESIAQALGPANAPQPTQVPKAFVWGIGLAVVGLAGFIVFKLSKGKG